MNQRIRVLNMMVMTLIVILPFQNCGRGYASFATASTPISTDQGSLTSTPIPTPPSSPGPIATPSPTPMPAKTPTWSAMTVNGAPSPRAGAFIFWTGSQILVYGGYRYDNTGAISFFNDGGLYDIQTNSWKAISTVGAPTLRYGTTPIWTGTKMIVWGGHRYFGPTSVATVNDGAIYDPATNTWTAMSQSGAPSPRTTQLVWTGSKLIVFAGSRYNTTSYIYLNDGAIFDPATNSWKAMSIAGAPSPRDGHSALWTGSKMIIWGGFVSSPLVRYSDGGIYDPATDSWSAIPTLDAPIPRTLQSAVWTGAKLVIAGGLDTTGNSLFKGGAFDPAAGTWSAIPDSPQLGQMAYAFTEVYNGMPLFYGGFTSLGFNTAVYSNKGALFNFALNSWLPMSTLGAPTPREGARQLEIGDGKFLLFGGRDIGPRNDGAIYDPAKDQWTSLPLQGAPKARSYHSAVFTGDSLVVFGGVVNQGQPMEFTNEGGVLTLK